MGPVFSSPSHHWDSELHLCRPWVCCYSLCEFVCTSVLLCPEDSFLGIIHPLWLLKSFCLLFYIVPWALRREVWGGHPTQDCPAVCLCVGSHLPEGHFLFAILPELHRDFSSCHYHTSQPWVGWHLTLFYLCLCYCFSPRDSGFYLCLLFIWSSKSSFLLVGATPLCNVFLVKLFPIRPQTTAITYTHYLDLDRLALTNWCLFSIVRICSASTMEIN